MGTHWIWDGYVPLGIKSSLNLDQFYHVLSKNQNSPNGDQNEPGPLSPGRARFNAESLTPPKKSSDFWRSKTKGAFFVGELSGALGAVIPIVTHHSRLGLGKVSLMDRDHYVAAWTAVGTLSGAALGNLTCAAFKVKDEYFLCDMIGGLVGGLMGYFITDSQVTGGFPGIPRRSPTFEQIKMDRLEIPTQPVVVDPPDPEKDHQWPVDRHGP